MTVKELIEKLKELPEDSVVGIQHRDNGGFYPTFDLDFEIEFGIFEDINARGRFVRELTAIK